LRRTVRIAIVGQPNVGKSTLFNAITRGNAIVTNWPGTTVEKHEGHLNYRDYELVVIDLPGIYGLSYTTLEERISRRFIVEEKPDVVVVLVESLNLERTLYLAIEIRELVGNIVVAVTKVDEAHSRGIHINFDLIERRLNTPVVPVSALKRVGLDRLLDTVIRSVGVEKPLLKIDYGELEPFIDSIEHIVQGYSENLRYPTRWLAIKFLEGDAEVEDILRKVLGNQYRELEEIREEAKRRIGIDLAAFISMKRFNYAQELVKNAIIKHRVVRKERIIDKIFFNPFTAPVISFSIIVAIFLAVFIVNTGYPISDILRNLGYSELGDIFEEYSLSSLVEKLFEYIGNAVVDTLGEGPLTSFIVDGVLGGLASVLVFIPLIAIAMAILGVLEDSGVLTRIAIGIHLLFQRIGLSGHSLLPITLSLGCNVAGVMGSRASPNPLERIKLVILTPFIPCQARLVVLLAIATAIGGFAGAILVPLAYFVAFSVFIVLSYIASVVSKRRGVYEEAELLLELPPLHRPYARVVWWFTWFYLKHFLVKAGTVIFSVSIISWILLHISLSTGYTEDVGGSIAAQISRFLAPLLSPLGISGEKAWITMYAIIMGFLAKELVVSAIVTVTSSISFEEAFQKLGLSIPSAIAFTLFITLYIPCLATLATIYSESKSFKYVLLSVIVMISTAYLVALLSYLVALML